MAEGKTFDETTMHHFTGSGPYVMSEVKPDERVTYTKNPTYWGKDLAISKGLWNFETLRFDYYRDTNAAFEASKRATWMCASRVTPCAGQVVMISRQLQKASWSRTLSRNARQHQPPALPSTRGARSLKMCKVREGLAMAFDFEWANANLFGGAYRRTYGYFSGSSNCRRWARPADEAERKLAGGICHLPAWMAAMPCP
jgi:peptide/nickel transport system substrate-binding protein